MGVDSAALQQPGLEVNKCDGETADSFIFVINELENGGDKIWEIKYN